VISSIPPKMDQQHDEIWQGRDGELR
jgi:hypothetical protein